MIVTESLIGEANRLLQTLTFIGKKNFHGMEDVKISVDGVSTDIRVLVKGVNDPPQVLLKMTQLYLKKINYLKSMEFALKMLIIVC